MGVETPRCWELGFIAGFDGQNRYTAVPGSERTKWVGEEVHIALTLPRCRPWLRRFKDIVRSANQVFQERSERRRDVMFRHVLARNVFPAARGCRFPTVSPAIPDQPPPFTGVAFFFFLLAAPKRKQPAHLPGCVHREAPVALTICVFVSKNWTDRSPCLRRHAPWVSQTRQAAMFNREVCRANKMVSWQGVSAGLVPPLVTHVERAELKSSILELLCHGWCGRVLSPMNLVHST